MNHNESLPKPMISTDDERRQPFQEYESGQVSVLESYASVPNTYDL